jgi:bacteriocin-like protein
MNNLNLTELSHKDLIQINGGVDEVAYNTGYAAGQVVGKMVKNFLTLTGFARLFALL